MKMKMSTIITVLKHRTILKASQHFNGGVRISNESDGPLLSRFAIEILLIPGMSDEPERVFSRGRCIITWERMLLGPENIERTECLKSWYRSGISKA